MVFVAAPIYYRAGGRRGPARSGDQWICWFSWSRRLFYAMPY